MAAENAGTPPDPALPTGRRKVFTMPSTQKDHLPRGSSVTLVSGHQGGNVHRFQVDGGEAPLAMRATHINDMCSGTPISAIRVLSTGQVVVGREGGKVFVLESDDSAVVTTLEGHTGDIAAIVELPGSRMATACTGSDCTVRVWSTSTWSQLQEVKLPAPALHLTLLTSGELAVAQGEEGVVLLDTASWCAAPLVPQVSAAYGVAALAKGALACATPDKLHVWRPGTVAVATIDLGHEGLPSSIVAVPRASKWVVLAVRDPERTWRSTLLVDISADASPLEGIRQLAGATDSAAAVVATSTKLVAAVGDNGGASLWHRPSGSWVAGCVTDHMPDTMIAPDAATCVDLLHPFTASRGLQAAWDSAGAKPAVALPQK